MALITSNCGARWVPVSSWFVASDPDDMAAAVTEYAAQGALLDPPSPPAIDETVILLTLSLHHY